MFNDIPATPALRAFEAAARLGSFTAAAEELGVTQGAISQHVKALEKYMDGPLFLRLPRGVVPTPEGRRAVEAVRDALQRIAAALGPSELERALTVSVLPGFAVKWLFPRLIKFDQQHPEIEVSISTSARLLDFASGEADVSIRYGRGGYPGLVVEHLLDDDMFPVCSPRLLDDGPPLRGVADLDDHVLLHDEIKVIDGIHPGWASWFRHCGLRPPRIANRRRFGQSNMVIQAAIEGMGVALGRRPLAIDDLSAGHLVRPFGAAVPSGYAYYLVCPRATLDRPKVALFRDWLHAEAARVQPLPEPLRYIAGGAGGARTGHAIAGARDGQAKLRCALCRPAGRPAGIGAEKERAMRKLVSSGRPWEDKAGYSRAVRAGPMVEIGLTSPSAPDGAILHPGDVYRQTRACLKIIGEALAEAGASFDDVIKTNIMMLDTTKWAEAGRAHAEVLGHVRPALSFVGVSGFFDPLIEVEVEVTAYIDADD